MSGYPPPTRQLAPASLQKLHTCSKQSMAKQKGRTWRGVLDNAPPAFDRALFARDNPKIPDPRLFDLSSSDEKEKHTQIPTAAQCAIHLELLAAFYQVRRKVLNSTSFDAVLGIVPKPGKVYRKKYQGYRWTKVPVNIRDSTFQTRRQEKWPVYLFFAAARFLKWASVVEAQDEQSTSLDAAIMLPPIDVLMVWHALLLNPSWFRALGYKRLLDYPFPWAQIHEVIDSYKPTWPYNHPETCSIAFRKKTLLEADLLSYLTSATRTQEFKAMLKKYGDVSYLQFRPFMPEKVNPNLLNKLPRGEVEFLRNCSAALADTREKVVFKLIDAVQRQAAFVGKMESHLWIRSPALEGTLTRALDRYSKFLKLFKLYPDKMLVPTLDIDLVWHTHQCSPAQYNDAMMKIAGRLIDHNDKLGKATLDPGFERTATLFRVRFGLEYSRCNCWDCEALLSAIENARLGGQDAKEQIASEVHRAVAYYRAVEIARRKGERLPSVLG